ncbi:DUF6233 domain-containing protein [Streptomyces sp. NPDC001139]
MTELPPDPTRLRAILAYLDQQITDNDTIGFYLQLQRDAVHQALDDTQPTQAQPKPRRRGRLPKGATGLPTFAPPRHAASSGFCLERQPRAVGPEPVRIHVHDCTSVTDATPISAQDARATLLDPSVIACAFCRPDQELGMDID